jgi:hypothetical protein
MAAFGARAGAMRIGAFLLLHVGMARALLLLRKAILPRIAFSTSSRPMQSQRVGVARVQDLQSRASQAALCR